METDDGEPMNPPPSGATAAEGASWAREDLDGLIAALGTVRAPADSRIPLGRMAHRAVSHLVARDVDVVRVELRRAVSALRDVVIGMDARVSALDARVGALEAQAAAMVDPNHSLADGRPGPARRINDLLDRLLALEAAYGAGPESVAVLLERVEHLEQATSTPAPPAPSDSAGR
jgi:BMFP domain-containing protein YqiC